MPAPPRPVEAVWHCLLSGDLPRRVVFKLVSDGGGLMASLTRWTRPLIDSLIREPLGDRVLALEGGFETAEGGGMALDSFFIADRVVLGPGWFASGGGEIGRAHV